MKRDLPAYVYRKGKKGYLYFVRGRECIRIHDEPGTPEFAVTYARLLRGQQPEPSRTMNKLITDYRSSDRYAALAYNTRKSYLRHFQYFSDVMGKIDPATIRRVHVNQMRDALADTPTDANRKVGALSVLFEHAIDIGWLDENPTRGVRRLKGKRPPRKPWPADLVRRFRETADERPLLIFELLIGTGQRIGDVLAMQWGHIEDDGIRVRQGKTGASVWIPFTDRLRTILAATPRKGLFIVAQDNGRSVSYQLAWQAMKRVRDEIGAEAYDLHALRHTAASELAALGLSDEHIKAITGHGSAAMVRLYSGAAAQRARAKEAQDIRSTKGER